MQGNDFQAESTHLERPYERGESGLYIQDTILEDRLSDSAPWVRHYMVGMKTDDPHDVTEGAREGTWRHAIVDEIKP